MPAAAQSTAKTSRRVARTGQSKVGALRAGTLRAGTARSGGQQTVDYGTLPQHVGYLLRLAQLRVWDDFYRRVGDTGISPSLYSALILIERNPGLQQSRLGEALGVARSGAMTMVDRLERLKLVERRADPHDRRAYGLFLTATGRARMSHFVARVQEHDRHIAAVLTPDEHHRLMALLRKFIAVPAKPDTASDKRSGIMEREETP